MRTVLTRGAVLLTLSAAAPALRAQQPALRVRDDAARHEMVIEVGPADLPAGEMKQLPAFHGTVPIDGWLHGFSIDLVDADGRPVPRQTLHHVNVISPERRELFSQIMLRVAAAGQETSPAVLPRMMGYRVHGGQPLIVTVMLNNETGRSYRGVTARVHFPYTAGSALLKPISVFPFYMDVMPPASLHSWNLPPGRSTRSWEARPAVAGRIIGVGGHLHQYGVALRLEDVTAHRVIWDGRPTVDRAGEVVSMPTRKFLWTLGVPVTPQHLYRLTAEYDNPTHDTIPDGAMGALGGVFIPASEASWPAVDRNDPELKLDWHLVHTGNQGPAMHLHGHGHAMPGMDRGAMPGMDHGAMSMDPPPTAGMTHAAMAAPSAPAMRRATAGGAAMPGMEHAAMDRGSAPGTDHGAAEHAQAQSAPPAQQGGSRAAHGDRPAHDRRR